MVAAWRNRPPVETDLPVLDAEDPEWDVWNPWLARERDLDEYDEEDDA